LTTSLPGARDAGAGKPLQFPKDSSLKILTSGLLGEQYIGIEAGADEKNLAAGDTVTSTQSAGA
jgi:phospholipid/cholesterol/gamma-HCH transport system substrate-binding protein